MNDYKFGNFLCRLREKNGMTQAQLAQMLDVTAAAVSKWENGESKPRIETLFALAQILGVSAEELMAGEHKSQSEEQEKQQKQKLLLSQIDNLLTTEVRWRRMVADFIDSIISLLPMVAFMLISIFHALKNEGSPKPEKMLFVLLLFPLLPLSVLALHLFKDVIAKGRSIGSRKKGLIILNENTGEPAHTKQLVLRNLFSLIIGADEIAMLITGRSLGDRVAQTITVSKKQLEELQGYIAEPTSPPPVFTDTKKNRRSVVIIVTSLLAPFLSLVVIFSLFIYKMNTGEHYLIAEEYLLSSKAFAMSHATEEDISCVSNSISGTPDNKDATLVFAVNGKHYTVICHKEGDTWTVCKDCTEFD